MSPPWVWDTGYRNKLLYYINHIKQKHHDTYRFHNIYGQTLNITEWEQGQCHAYDGYLLNSNRLEKTLQRTANSMPSLPMKTLWKMSSLAMYNAGNCHNITELCWSKNPTYHRLHPSYLHGTSRMYRRVGWLEVVEHVSWDTAYELYREFTGAKNVKDKVPIPDSDDDTWSILWWDFVLCFRMLNQNSLRDSITLNINFKVFFLLSES